MMSIHQIRTLCLIIGLLLFAGIVTAVQAQAPQTINFQGYLTDAAGAPLTGTYSMTFKLYTSETGGTAVWTETQPTVTVTNGVYNVRLGSVTPITLSTPTQYYLGVTVGADAEMTPRTTLSSVMSALMLRDVTINDKNTFVGQNAGTNTTGNWNTFVGGRAGNANTTGTANTFVGSNAGAENTTGVGNVFLGYYAGCSETGSNRLYIANSSEPLIYGEFDTKQLKVNGSLIVDSTTNGGLFLLQSGDLLLKSSQADKQEIRFENTGLPNIPQFKIGRIITAGDGSPELRVLFQNMSTVERSVFELDEKGIVASVKPTVGSHFEGFIQGDSQPLFRLNSFPSMQIEMGAGGDNQTDVILRRSAANTFAILTNNAERLRVNANGDIGIGTTTPQATLDVNGYLKLAKNTSAPSLCDASKDGSIALTSNYRLCVCNGTQWVFTSDGTTGCSW